MIWAFFFALFFVTFAWKPIYKRADDFMEYCFLTLSLVFLTFVIFLLGVGFALLIGLAMPKHWTEPETEKLVSLRDSDSINGYFFLRIGSIGTTQYYFFYKEIGKGYQPDKIRVADNVTVLEEKRQDGEFRAYTYQFVNSSLRWVALDWIGERYEFIIPEGGFKKNFVPQ